MNEQHSELMQRLEQFQLDSPDAAYPFSHRLADENAWRPSYAERVIVEYKRFAFLAVVAGHPVSPSEDVDQAWHLHLTYSESYWKTFCPAVLGRPLHHSPTRGGESERKKFDDWYARTIESYEKFFGEPPPPDIWPSPEKRRQEKHDFIRVDRARNWVIPRPRLTFNPVYLLWPVSVLILIFCTGAMMAQGVNVFNWRGPDFLFFYVLLFAGCWGLAFWTRQKLRLPDGEASPDSAELNGYSIAFLNGGHDLAVDTAIANLINQKAMRLDPKKKRLKSLVPKPGFSHEMEQAAYAGAISTDGVLVTKVRSSARQALSKIGDDLKARGLLVGDGEAMKAIWLPLTIPAAAVSVGIIKVFVGLGRGKPVGFLVVLCVISAIVTLVTFARRPLRSIRGDRFLARLKEKHTGSKFLGRNLTTTPPSEFATVVGLFGMSALAGTDLAGIDKSLRYPGGDGSSYGSSYGGGGGGGCGGGGGGSGCGGCGGGH